MQSIMLPNFSKDKTKFKIYFTVSHNLAFSYVPEPTGNNFLNSKVLLYHNLTFYDKYRKAFLFPSFLLILLILDLDPDPNLGADRKQTNADADLKNLTTMLHV
jgi:hypothetical protein